MIVRVTSAEPRLFQYRRSALRLRIVDAFAVSELLRALYGEVPVGESELGVDELQAVLESVGDEGVARQEAKTVMELPDSMRGQHGTVMEGSSGERGGCASFG